MKSIKKLLPFLLSVMMIVTAFAVTASAAGGATNVSMVVSATEVNVGDTVTVTISSTAMKVSSFVCKLGFDTDLLTVATINSPTLRYDTYDEEEGEDVEMRLEPTAISTVTEANGNGNVGATWAGALERDYKARATLLKVTFTAKAAGTVTFTLVEDSSGTDGFKDTADTQTLVIKATTPVCNHENTKAVPNGNGTHKLVCTNEACNEFVVNESVACSGGEATCAEKAVCQYCETEYGEKSTTHKDIHPIKGVSNNDGKTHAVYNYCTSCGTTLDVVAEKDPCFDTRNNTTQQEGKDGLCDICDGVIHVCTHDRYGDITAKTHQSYCACGAKIGEAVNHDYSYDAANHKCVCGAVEKFVITMDANGGKFSNGAPIYPISSQYGEPFYAVPADPTKEGCKFVGWNTKVDGSGETVNLAPGAWTFTENLTVYAQWCDHATTTAVNNNDGTHDIVCSDKCEELIVDNAAHNYESNYTCVCGAKFTGWDGKVYVVNAEVQKTGWTKIDEAWYYLDTATGERATGVVRVPYNTELGYAPDQETLDYCAAKNKTFIDAESALFVFDAETGKFQSTLTGKVEYLNVTRYVENGLLVWNPGFVTLEGEGLVYFIGDEANGGNKPADGLTYIIRVNGAEGYTKGDAVILDNGSISTFSGVKDGYYYENGKLVPGKGLVQLGSDYYYVRSAGQVATGWYYVTKTNDIDLGTTKLFFGEDGKMAPVVNGIVEEGGKLYYYEGNRKAYGAGLVKLVDGSIIYVRSNGQLVTGEYYVTNVNDMEGFKAGDLLVFDSTGKLVTE